MDWVKGKIGQIIALVSIVGTLAGFGYTGATYVNRIENLEKKIGTLVETEDAQQAIEERFAGIETSVTFINKTIDESLLLWIKEAQDNVSAIQVTVGKLESDIENIDIPEVEPLQESIANTKASVAGIKASVDAIYADVQSLKNKSDNPLAQ
jgi:uncharacterized coiled-coil protein SlyX